MIPVDAMADCPNCGKHLTRTHRTAVQKLFYADVLRCTKCGNRLKRRHPFLNTSRAFFFSRRSHCIRCGTPNVDRLKKRDRIDSVSRHPASMLLALTGAPFNRCTSCRLQYHDWRRPGRKAASA
jgi:uncharacterized protein with PIN domain